MLEFLDGLDVAVKKREKEVKDDSKLFDLYKNSTDLH